MTECPKCGKQTLVSSERVDSCDACGWYSYYPDAYVPGDQYREGYADTGRYDDDE